jgi:hypothetical protein
VAIYAAIFILAVAQGKLGDPPLPPVAVAPESGQEVRGRLLNHTEGNWHIITDVGDILAIPDSKSGIVTIPTRPGTLMAGTPTARTQTPRPVATPGGSP